MSDASDEAAEPGADPQANSEPAESVAEPSGPAPTGPDPKAAASSAPTPAKSEPPEPEPVEPRAVEAGTAAADPSNPFLVSLITAMRGVVEEARASTSSTLQSQLEARIAELRARSNERADDLRQTAERDISAVGEWSTAEMERIRRETNERVESRRRQLDEQLTTQTVETERTIERLRERITEYENELSAFFAQLNEITDPAAFVAAAKKIPSVPELTAAAAAETTAAPASAPSETPPTTAKAAKAEAPTEEVAQPQPDKSSVGVAAEPAVPPAAEPLGGEPASASAAEPPASEAPAAERVSTEKTTAIVVKGLGSFGAITSFKQSLEGAEGIGAVSLSLGPTGEFVYRATHEASVDLASAISDIETGAEVEQQPDGSLRVTVHRTR